MDLDQHCLRRRRRPFATRQTGIATGLAAWLVLGAMHLLAVDHADIGQRAAVVSIDEPVAIAGWGR